MGISLHFLFRCPVTGLNVQGMGHTGDPEPDDRPRITHGVGNANVFTGCKPTLNRRLIDNGCAQEDSRMAGREYDADLDVLVCRLNHGFHPALYANPHGRILSENIPLEDRRQLTS